MTELDDLAIPPGYAHDIFDLTGRVAVVTGAGSGLGEAISIGFAQAGMTVVLADVNVRRRGTGCRNDRRARSDGDRQAARRRPARRPAIASPTRSSPKLDRVDVLVNSAGSAFRCPAEDFPEDKFDFIVGLNMKGTYLCCQAFGRKMLDQGKGSIINMGSIGGFIGYPLASAYLASKGAVVQITKGLALEWRDRGVRVNGIGPTLMDSPLTRAAATTTSVTADFIKARMLRPRLGLPRELIGAAIFLASDASELVTGHMLMCDDGYLTA